MKDKWAQGDFSSDHFDRMAILNANAIGKCEAYARVAGLEAMDLESSDD